MIKAAKSGRRVLFANTKIHCSKEGAQGRFALPQNLLLIGPDDKAVLRKVTAARAEHRYLKESIERRSDKFLTEPLQKICSSLKLAPATKESAGKQKTVNCHAQRPVPCDKGVRRGKLSRDAEKAGGETEEAGKHESSKLRRAEASPTRQRRGQSYLEMRRRLAVKGRRQHGVEKEGEGRNRSLQPLVFYLFISQLLAGRLKV